MKEFVKKLISRLEEYQENNTQCKSSDDYELGQFNACEYAIEIVHQLAKEYNNGWIPASKPPKCFMLSDGSLIPFLVCDKLMWHPYIAFYNGKEWFTALEKLNPTAYMPLPPAYVPKEGRE